MGLHAPAYLCWPSVMQQKHNSTWKTRCYEVMRVEIPTTTRVSVDTLFKLIRKNNGRAPSCSSPMEWEALRKEERPETREGAAF